MSGKDTNVRMVERLPENFEKEGLEVVKNLARRLEAYVIHLENERVKDAGKLNKYSDDLTSCEIAFEKSKAEVKNLMETNEKLDSEKERSLQKYNLIKISLEDKNSELKLAQEKIEKLTSELNDLNSKLESKDKEQNVVENEKFNNLIIEKENTIQELKNKVEEQNLDIEKLEKINVDLEEKFKLEELK
ncbi:unnamed protein product, partial [Brachionus calyciflorus]